MRRFRLRGSKGVPARVVNTSPLWAQAALATRMNKDGTRDLQWWHVPTWAHAAPRFIATWLGVGLAAGLAAGLATGLWAALQLGLWYGPAFGLRYELSYGLQDGAEEGIALAIVAGFLAYQAWLSYIPVTGVVVVGVMVGLGAWLVAGLWVGLVVGLVYPQSWSSSLAFVQLAMSGRTPVHLMRFLEDARSRSVLRAVGPVYQFRHARLQDRLAAQGSVAGQDPGERGRADAQSLTPT
jgi:hypothetical protein